MYAYRHYKNKIDQKPGWDRAVVDWCLQEARNNNLKEPDFWGGFVIGETKIEVRIVRLKYVTSGSRRCCCCCFIFLLLLLFLLNHFRYSALCFVIRRMLRWS